MPPPSSENDLKRLARRRLIGAVALALLAVIVLPLLLEDEPPPTSLLSVRMAAVPAPAREHATQPEGTDNADASAAPQTSSASPELRSAPADSATPLANSAQETAEPVKRSKPEPSRPDPVQPEAPRPVLKPQPREHAAVSHAKPAAASEAFVVQLAALSDGAKARELKARAALAGLPAYTDTVGSLTRVRVGPYETREAAVTAAVKLAEHGMTGQVLAK